VRLTFSARVAGILKRADHFEHEGEPPWGVGMLFGSGEVKVDNDSLFWS
jgi:hypothetical protein